MRGKYRAFAFACTVAIAALANTPSAMAVAKGSDVPEGAFGFAAKLTMTHIPRTNGTVYDSACSAALIAPQWMITAGHCFHDADNERVAGKTPYRTIATLGRVDESDLEHGEIRRVVEVFQSPVTDVALAKLDAPITTIIPLTIRQSAPEPGEKLTLAGWGSLSEIGARPSLKLQQGTVAVARVGEYTLGVHGVWPAADTSACSYDSGAPYFDADTGRLVSIESTGPDCPHPGLETTARTDVIADWIAAEQEESTGQQGSHARCTNCSRPTSFRW